MYAFKFLSVFLAISLCCLCVCADDSIPDLLSTGDSGESNSDGLVSIKDEFADPGNDNDLPDDVGYYDTLIVNDLIIEADEAAAAAEVYGITPNVQYGSYFHADITYFGDVYIYIPVAASSDCFSYNSDGIPINITASSITGYIAGESSNQSIQFPSFGLPRYRLGSGAGYDYQDITRWHDIDSTVIVYSSDDNFSSYSNTYYLRMIFFMSAANLVINFLLRLLGGFRS